MTAIFKALDHPYIMAMTKANKRPVVLCILDGWGWREDAADNAVLQANTPNFDRLWASSPRGFLNACEEDVGLPLGQFGNSEVGHMNLGAGRVVYQDLPRIDNAIATGQLAHNPELAKFCAALKRSGGTCHLMGVISPGGVHAHQDHIAALVQYVSATGVPVVIHVFTDGRDVPPKSAADYVATFEKQIAGVANARIVSVSGRYYAMDRDKRWDRVKLAYDTIVSGQGKDFATASSAIEASYAANITDEFILPCVIGSYAGMKDGDGVLMGNFRTDRARELLQSLLDQTFDGFIRACVVKFVAALGMVEYSSELNIYMQALFTPINLTQLLGEVVANAGMTQLRAAETEKYPHVTFFFNGGREEPYPGEERILVASPKVATYDMQPEMSAPELTEKVVAAIDSGAFDLAIVNFANPDMVGHTGILSAAVKAVEAVDTGMGQIVDAVQRQGGAILITADHGNCEVMRDAETGEPHTAHTLNIVPAMLVGGPAHLTSLGNGRLADVAPTLLALLGIAQPAEMTGRSLLAEAPSVAA